MPPSGDEDDDGLTREQLRWLGLVALAIGVLTVLGIVGVTVASHTWGTGGGQDGPPVAAFTVETLESDAGIAANVTHAGGDGIHPPSLVIRVDGERLGTWESLGGQGADVVTPGSSVVVRAVERGDDLAIAYVDDGDVTVLQRSTV